MPVDRLVDDLWGERPPATARKSLQVRVAGLRRALPEGVLATHGPGYLIHVAGDELDLHRFERLVGEGRTALEQRNAGDATSILVQALELWRGPPLADFASEAFAQPAIARLEELRLSAIELRIDAELVLGRSADAVAELEELVASHPFRERLRAQLMLALYREGRQADALDVYRRSRALLVSELGIEPGPALRELERAILEHDPSLNRAVAAEHERSILVALRDDSPGLLDVAEALATRPRREVILAQLVEAAGDLATAAKSLERHRQTLASREVVARAVTFTSPARGDDLVRIALEQDVDLVLAGGGAVVSAGSDVERLLLHAPCDVAVHVGSDRLSEQPVLVLFAGGEHDWAAAELGAWLARARGTALRLAGPAEGAERDASRTLASASLALQRVFGLAAEPMLLQADERDVVAAATGHAVVVAGLPERWRRDGLGRIRSALANDAEPPVLLVRRGLRPGGLAPRASLTRFTWTLAGA